MGSASAPVKAFRLGEFVIGAGRLTVIAGPCMLESLELCLEVGRSMRDLCSQLDCDYIFKGSFDKANRTSLSSPRGPGLDGGLEILQRVTSELGVPVLTDIHEPWQAAPAAVVVDMLQIPAFLARQTDLLVAAARTGRPVNVKKAQFMAPWDMRPVVEKLSQAGCAGVLLTERGSTFGYNTLVVDFRGLPTMRALGYPVCFDVTHSLQQPSGLGSQSGATREFAPHLARAAAAVGIDALFLEVHTNPAAALSDAAAQLAPDEASGVLREVCAIRGALQPG